MLFCTLLSYASLSNHDKALFGRSLRHDFLQCFCNMKSSRHGGFEGRDTPARQQPAPMCRCMWGWGAGQRRGADPPQLYEGGVTPVMCWDCSRDGLG